MAYSSRLLPHYSPTILTPALIALGLHGVARAEREDFGGHRAFLSANGIIQDRCPTGFVTGIFGGFDISAIVFSRIACANAGDDSFTLITKTFLPDLSPKRRPVGGGGG